MSNADDDSGLTPRQEAKLIVKTMVSGARPRWTAEQRQTVIDKMMDLVNSDSTKDRVAGARVLILLERNDLYEERNKVDQGYNENVRAAIDGMRAQLENDPETRRAMAGLFKGARPEPRPVAAIQDSAEAPSSPPAD